RPATVDAALAATAVEVVPPESMALATTVLFEVSTNCTVPVGVPAPGAAGATTPVRINWPEARVNETAVLVEAGKTVTVTVPADEDQVPSPLYLAVMVCVPTA